MGNIFVVRVLQKRQGKELLGRKFIQSLIFGASFIPFGAALAVENNALPSSGDVVSGSASFDYSISDQLHIQQDSDRVVINWDSFNIGKDALTQFHQNNSSSIAVNRVTGAGQDPTQILGTLKSNGVVMVLDRNGVLFGQGSVVDVGGVVASTGDIDNAEFMGGSNILNLTDVNTSGSIVNNGTITVSDGGLAAFVAPHIVNNGVIEAKMGRVALASGTQATLDLYGDGLVEVAVDDAFKDALIENTGVINAEGGNVLMTVPTVQNVVDNLINIDGIVNVSSVTQKGGKIVLEGGNIKLSGDLKANGKTGGGTIHVGGEYLGTGDTRHAQSVYISDSALVETNAIDIGDGGEVIVWSDQETWMAGSIKALGGSISGDGGFIETSSKDYLRIRGYADASAINGNAGQWLLDPSNVSIVNGAGFDASGGGTINPTADTYTVDADTIEMALNAGTSVTITTTNGAGTEAGDITMTGATINKTAGADTSLTLQADNAIILTNSTISSTTGALDVTLHADADNNDAGYIYLDNTDVTTNGGDFVAGGGLNPLTDYAWGDATLNDGVTIEGGSQITTAAGNISIMGHGWNDGLGGTLRGVVIAEASVLTATTGQITLDGVGGDGGINNAGVALNDANTVITSTDGDILITGQGGTFGVGDSRNNHGVSIATAEVISTGTGVNAATITIDGTGADGNRRNYGVIVKFAGSINSVDGDIDITGQGGDGAAEENYGVYLESVSDITSTGTGADAAAITIDGTGGVGTVDNHGVYLADAGTVITSDEGDISITGQGGSNGAAGSDNNYGIYVYSADITSTGTGVSAANITIDGTGGNGEDNNRGVHVRNDDTDITTIDGDISITGQGGSNGSALSSGNNGIYFASDANLLSTGTAVNAGTITLDGTGGAGDDNNLGVEIVGTGTVISSDEGNISITGQGGSNGLAASDGNYGVSILGDAEVSSTGTGADAATITVDGIGGNGEDGNYGAYIAGSLLALISVDGDISLTGVAGTNGAAGSDNGQGIFISGGSVISSTGTTSDAATITINGTGADGEDSNHGINIKDVGTTITSVNGDISITGQGGDGTLTGNRGIFVQNSARIESTGTGVDAATITINGTGGDGTDNNHGVHVTSNGTLITSVDGAIDITGLGASDGVIGSSNNYGVYVDSGGDITSTGTGVNAATITIDGTGGAGEDINHGVYLDGGTTEVSSVIGDISVAGQGGNGLDDSNYGVYINNAVVSSTGVGADVADITINGTGGLTSGRGNIGSYLRSGDVTTVDGDISIIGLGASDGSDQSNAGTYLTNNALVSSTGTGVNAGTITIDGTGGTGSQYNHGLYITGSQVDSIDGDITLTGQGGNSTGQNQVGVYLLGSADIISTGVGVNAAKITIDGTASAGNRTNDGVRIQDAGTTITSVDGAIDITGQGNSSGADFQNIGIHLHSAAVISSTGTGVDAATITLDGTGGDGTTDNYGVYLTNTGTLITSADGAIDITGQGGDGSGIDNYGVYVSAADITSTGTGADAATITLDGTGGSGTENNYGIYMDDNNTSIETVDGDISITGQGGSDGTNRTNSGIYIIRSDITSTGTGANAGTITLNGTGANGTRNNVGVNLSHVNSEITSVEGDITIIGQGGHGTNDANQGVAISSIVSSTGTGVDAANITISGTGGNGANENYGTILRDTGAVISTVDGNIDITGQGGNGVNRNYGIWVRQDIDVMSTGVGVNAGTITLNGTGGNGTNDNYGVYLDDAGTTITSVDGAVDVTGQGQGSGINNDDFHIDDADITTTNSDIELSADTYVLANAANISAGDDLVVTARTAGTTIGLGSGAGTLNLDNTELNLLDAVGAVRIGEVSSASTINIDNVDISGAGYDVEIIGGAITIDNGLTGGGTVFLQATAGQDITLNDVITAVGAGNSLVLASDNEIINNFGAGALDPGAGRYLAFVESPDKITANGLNPSEVYGQTFTSLEAISVSGSLDSFVYEISLDTSPDIFEVDPYLAEENAKLDIEQKLEIVNSLSEEIEGSGCLANYGSMSGSCLVSGGI